MVKICKFKDECWNPECRFRHSPKRLPACPDGVLCWNHITDPEEGCPDYTHPDFMQKACKWGKDCKIYQCWFAHPSDASKDCPEAADCKNQFLNGAKRCLLKHPKPQRVSSDRDQSTSPPLPRARRWEVKDSEIKESDDDQDEVQVYEEHDITSKDEEQESVSGKEERGNDKERKDSNSSEKTEVEFEEESESSKQHTPVLV